MFMSIRMAALMMQGRQFVAMQILWYIPMIPAAMMQTENLRCPLPEIKTHVHVESCYAVPETEAATVHIHTDACYATEQGELLCTEAAHTHRDACYQETESLICDIPESDSHQHSPSASKRRRCWSVLFRRKCISMPMNAMDKTRC